jgi:diketogulonate reductase-like aldo/keto reductase
MRTPADFDLAREVPLNNGVRMPRVGLGVWRLSDPAAETVLTEALAAGYRLVDTGDLYENESGVGRAIARSAVPRDEIFVTSKAWNADGRDVTLRAFEASLARLGLDRLDLYLIHWPRPQATLTAQAWRALESLLAEGRVRAIGVSNFGPADLDRLIRGASVVPAVNQIQLHPWHAQAESRAVHARHGIATQAWGPLGRGRGLLDSPMLIRIAAKHGRSPAQIALRWQLQLGTAVIPKSARPERLRQNIALFDFTLDDDDLRQIAALDQGRLLGPARQPAD